MELKKSFFSEIQCFGLPIAATDFESAVQTVMSDCKNLKNEYITFVNVHSLVMSREHPAYRKVQAEAAVRFADGHPIFRYQKKKSEKNGQTATEVERVAGPDFMDEVLRASAERGYRHFFYGSSEENLQKLAKHIQKSYPEVQIAGCLAAPYIESIRKSEFYDIFSEDIETINDANADFVWIGLGAPKQEIFMYLAKGKVNGLMLGVGAAFDFLGKTKKRAPKWMQHIGLEWFYRLLQEPHRLAGRYIRTNIKFIILQIQDAICRSVGRRS